MAALKALTMLSKLGLSPYRRLCRRTIRTISRIRSLPWDSRLPLRHLRPKNLPLNLICRHLRKKDRPSNPLRRLHRQRTLPFQTRRRLPHEPKLRIPMKAWTHGPNLLWNATSRCCGKRPLPSQMKSDTRYLRLSWQRRPNCARFSIISSQVKTGPALRSLRRANPQRGRSLLEKWNQA